MTKIESMTAGSIIADGLTSDPSRRWFVVRTEPQRERTAQTHLTASGNGAYLPLERRTINKGRGLSRTLYLPIFRGYLFLWLYRGGERWRDIQETIGVLDFLRVDHRPAIVENNIIEQIALKEAELLAPPPKVSQQYTIGSQIRVLDGPFMDWIATIDKLDDRGRITALLDLMGRATPVEFDAYQIEAA